MNSLTERGSGESARNAHKAETLDLVVVGHLLNETIEFPDRTIGPVLGSPAAYISVAAKRLGAEVGLVTRIGNDMPRELMKPLFEAGVDCDGIRVDGDATTTNLLCYDTGGDKKLHFQKKAPDITFADFPTRYLDARLICISPIDFEVPLETVSKVKGLDSLVAVELGGYGGAASSEHPRDVSFIEELVKDIDIVKAGAEDCRYLFGKTDGVEDMFIKWGAGVGIVTQGDQGALVATKTERFIIPAFNVQDPDCTGAGDAFSAGFFVEYLNSRDIEASGRFASATASLVIEGTGGVTVGRMPSADDVCRRMESMLH